MKTSAVGRRLLQSFTHTDEQIGRVLAEMETLNLIDETRVLYTSDHGEAAGHHGILGKANHYEHGIGVPLVMAGPGIPQGRVVEQLASHVDLFPTIVEAVGAEIAAEDIDLPGTSLWPAIQARPSETPLPSTTRWAAGIPVSRSVTATSS